MHLQLSDSSAPVATSLTNSAQLARAVPLCLWYCALWLMLGRYWGLQHDAQLYVLQGLNVLAPDLYGSDIYLRHAGRSELTLFPYVTAFFVRLLHINGGAALLTAVSIAAWYAAAWLLLRRIMARSQASLAIGLLLVVPIWYGSHQVFRLAEYFLSARPLAEALSLATLAAVAAGRHGLASMVAVAAVFVHPLMAFPALLVALCGACAGTQALRPAAVTLAAFVIAPIGGALIFGGPDRLMSDGWLELTRARSGYLFATNWSPGDWQNSVVPIATTVIASLVLRPSRLGTLAFAAAIVAIAGILLTIVTGAVPLTLILQGQPWRWTWLAGFVAVAALVVLLPRLWRGTTQERVVAVMLLSAWLLRDWSSSDQLPPVGAAGLLSIAAVALWVARDRVSESVASLMLKCSMALCAVVVIGLIASAAPIVVRDSHFSRDPLWIQLGAELLRVFPPVAAMAVVLGWALARGRLLRRGRSVITVAAVIAAVAAAPEGMRSWLQDPLSDADRRAFADWRALVPKGSEVFWPDFAQGPWFLLERPSYLSRSQLAGIVFSKALAVESRHRAAELGEAVSPDFWFGAAPGQTHSPSPEAVCRAEGVDYAVLEEHTETALATLEWPGAGRYVYLYACSGNVTQANGGSRTREPDHTRARRQTT